ncbi:sensor histidine kinase [Streptomyces sp. NPDC094438]|uniref:sensor histidine kinase n=1 Tax=Streptomyces sp. NPDC094438 TaxID=3366061 RepID=UPI00381EA4DC
MKAVLLRWWPRTLRGQLSLVAVATAAFLMVVLTVVFNTIVHQRLLHQADDHLRTRAAAVAATVDTSGTAVRVLETPNDELLDTNVWIFAGPALLEHPPTASPTSAGTRAAADLAALRTQRCTTLRQPAPVRLCAQPVPAGSGSPGRAAVVTAVDLGPYQSSADTVLFASIALDAAMLTCTYGLTRLAVGRALRPVHTMTAQATQWSAVASEERFGGTRRPTELARLGSSLDALLDRIQAVLRHEQQLTGELSHELRNPLARIVAELDWWQAHPRSAAETRASHTAIADAADSMRTICDTLLDDARDRAGTTPGTAEVLPALHRLVGRLTVPPQVSLTVSGEESVTETVTAGVSPALLDRIVGPLVDNALRYARSSVRVLAYRQDGGVRIAVTDDGSGVPASFTAELFHPGRRADPGDGHGGAGLGLPLARRLARSAGGDVHYDRQHAPGARFTVSLPSG